MPRKDKLGMHATKIDLCNDVYTFFSAVYNHIDSLNLRHVAIEKQMPISQNATL